jgi:carboxyl-terminal processing protease
MREKATWIVVALVALASALSAYSSAGQPDSGATADPKAHLAEIVSVMQREWLFRSTMNWDMFREQVFAKARDASTREDALEAIRFALSALGDKHTYYVKASGEPIFNPESPSQSTGECNVADAPPVVPPKDVGYVRVRINPPTSKEEIQEAVRRGDQKGLVGWIVDLRNSRGGNMWPAVAGLGPLLGDGTVGFFLDASGKATSWGHMQGRALLDHQVMDQIAMPHPTLSGSRVAVLTDVGVASSGEAIAIGFRGRPNSRSFGTPTCGLSTAVEPFPLKTGGRIAVVTAVMADRTRRAYGGRVEPDETITNPSLVAARAVNWLRALHNCIEGSPAIFLAHRTLS